jgi:hypothetical protein
VPVVACADSTARARSHVVPFQSSRKDTARTPVEDGEPSASPVDAGPPTESDAPPTSVGGSFADMAAIVASVASGSSLADMVTP